MGVAEVARLLARTLASPATRQIIMDRALARFGAKLLDRPKVIGDLTLGGIAVLPSGGMLIGSPQVHDFVV